MSMPNAMVLPETSPNNLLDNVVKELDTLESKSCNRCNYIEDCNHLCGDIQIIDNIRQEIQTLAKQ